MVDGLVVFDLRHKSIAIESFILYTYVNINKDDIVVTSRKTMYNCDVYIQDLQQVKKKEKKKMQVKNNHRKRNENI